MTDKDRQEIRHIIQEELERKLQSATAPSVQQKDSKEKEVVKDRAINVETVSPAY